MQPLNSMRVGPAQMWVSKIAFVTFAIAVVCASHLKVQQHLGNLVLFCTSSVPPTRAKLRSLVGSASIARPLTRAFLG